MIDRLEYNHVQLDFLWCDEERAFYGDQQGIVYVMTLTLAEGVCLFIQGRSAYGLVRFVTTR